MKKSTVIIERVSKTDYSFAKSQRFGIRAVSQALTFRNPNPFAYSDVITKFNRRDLTFHIGMLSNVVQYCEDEDISYEVNDWVYEMPDVTIDDRLEGNYIHQRYAVEAFFKRRFGIIVIPTRGGKTFIASEILRIFTMTEKGNALFIVDNTTLFTQAVDEIKTFFGRYGGVEVGEIKAGSIDFSKRITVAMIQTIQSTLSKRSDKVRQKRMKAYLKDLRLLCVDEIHDNCSDSKLKIYKMCKNLDFQLCLSATPYRSGAYVQNLKLQDWSGDIVYNISEDTLRQRGVLSNYKVFMMMIDHNSNLTKIKNRDFAGLRTELIYENEFRNKILLDIIEICNHYKLKTLVLFQSVEHGKMLQSESGFRFISGETSGEEREVVKKAFLAEDGGVLMASNIFKKGVTLPEVQVLINADDALESANVIQRKGRVLGATKTKKRSLIIDIFDLFEQYFSTHSEARLNTYVYSIGENNVGILDTTVVSWKQTLDNWIRKWFDGE